ncbi:MAG: hypothetical protein JNL89_08180 [Rhodanobacteraceae bacterium]|nr:hypothetical protein [Rhodanobacteraceae bacterium]
MSCICQDPQRSFNSDPPEKFPDLVIDHEDARFPAVIEVHCRVCGTRWKVMQIPYGGIYGDFDWQRIDAPPAES